MRFRDIKKSLIDLLGNAAQDRYQVVGFQRQGKSAEEVKGNNRLVQVYYSEGDFPRKSGTNAFAKHLITFRIDLTVSAPAVISQSVLSTNAQANDLALAISQMQESAAIADESWDEIVDIIIQIIMDARALDLGCQFPIADRWISHVKKDQPISQGSLIVITGMMAVTCSIDEQFSGDIGGQCSDLLTADIKLDEEVVE